MQQIYAIALGSNMRHGRFGRPEAVLALALRQLDAGATRVLVRSPVRRSAPLGPSLRTYANAAALLETDLMPEDLLDHLKQMERDFGRRPGGQAWRARPLDLDILLWSGGPYASKHLCIPHRFMAVRDFVLTPLCDIAPDWRDPLSGLTARHLKARLDQKRPAA